MRHGLGLLITALALLAVSCGSKTPTKQRFVVRDTEQRPIFVMETSDPKTIRAHQIVKRMTETSLDSPEGQQFMEELKEEFEQDQEIRDRVVALLHMIGERTGRTP
jgi:uncharacterized lipoprotein YmbA